MDTLSTKHLKNCQFAISRYEAMKNLPVKGKIAEVGVLAGDLSQWFLTHLKPHELHLIDLFNCPDFPGQNRFSKKEHESFVNKRFAEEIEQGKVVLKKGYSWDMLSAYESNYFDLIYIDAAHDYQSVKKDLTVSLEKIKPTGRIAMNDYIMYDHLANSKYGVVQATNEFCVENDWELEYFAFHPNLFCDVVLRKIQ